MADYYKTLGVNRDASSADINAAYRHLAINWHPQRHPKKPNVLRKFQEVSEAYQVLSNLNTRAVFDQFGEEGLKRGVADGMGGVRGGKYEYNGDYEAIFAKFFGSNNPFEDLWESTSEYFDRVEGKVPNKMPPMHVALECTLEELYMGCTKTVKVDKTELNPATGLTNTVTDELSVQVKRGYHSGTEIRFENRGNQEPGTLPADIVFTVKELKHDTFTREGANLICKTPVTVLETLVGCTVSVSTLDGRTLSVPVNDIISPSYVKKIPAEGMPIARGANLDLDYSFGDLVLQFSITYPEKLNDAQKEMLRTAFTVPGTLNKTQKAACSALQEAFTYPYVEKEEPVAPEPTEDE